MEMGPLLKFSSDRLVKQEIEPVTPGLQGQMFIHFTGPRSVVGNVSDYRWYLTPDPIIASLIPARSHTFVEIDHEIFSTVILLPSANLFKKGCCQLQAKVCAQSTG